MPCRAIYDDRDFFKRSIFLNVYKAFFTTHDGHIDIQKNIVGQNVMKNIECLLTVRNV
jgi:hypothetical protein